MSGTAVGRRRRGPGRLDPTVRALLRAFLSPPIADRYASALQPIAVADRDAALAGAVSTLRARFFVLPEELAVALVEDAGWPVADVSTLLALPTMQVRTALRAAARKDEPRFSATPPPDLDAVDDEAAAVEAMLGTMPRRRRDAGRAATEADEAEPVDVELATALPTHVGQRSLEARFRRADRIQRTVVNGTILVLLGMVLAAILTASPGSGGSAVPDEDAVAIEPTPSVTPAATPSATASPSPSTSPGVPVGPAELAEARFVASVDPETGDPGPALSPATMDDDPRLWLRFERLPADELLVSLRFTAPSGRSTVRPVLIRDRTPLVSVRLPDELGRDPGRYSVRIDAEGLRPELVELEVASDEDGDEA